MTESLDAIMAGRDANASAPTSEAPLSTSPDTARDEHGRFAPKQEAEPPVPEVTQEAPKPQEPPKAVEPEKPQGMVPQQALHAERQRYRALEQQMSEMRQMVERLQPKPDSQTPTDPLAQFVADPNSFFQQQVAPISQQVAEAREMVLEMYALQSHGADKVQQAKQAAEELRDMGDPYFPVLVGRLKSAANPFEELVRWNNERSVLTKMGSDPEAYINAEVERRMAERAQQQPAAAQGSPLPPSLAGARSAAPRQGGAAYEGPRPLSEIMKR